MRLFFDAPMLAFLYLNRYLLAQIVENLTHRQVSRKQQTQHLCSTNITMAALIMVVVLNQIHSQTQHQTLVVRITLEMVVTHLLQRQTLESVETYQLPQIMVATALPI